MHYIERVREPGESFSANAVGYFRHDLDEEYFQALPGTAATAAIVAEIRKEAETARTEYTRTMPLGEPCVQDAATPAECVPLDDARYRRTFDGASGHA